MRVHYVYEDREYWYCESCGNSVSEEDESFWYCKDSLKKQKEGSFE